MAMIASEIDNTVSSSNFCILISNGIVSQAVQEVREGEHEFLNVASVDNGRLLLSLFIRRGERFKEGNNRLVCESHERGGLGCEAGA